MRTILAAEASADDRRIALDNADAYRRGDLLLLPGVEGSQPPGEILKVVAVEGSAVEVLRDWTGSGGGPAAAGSPVVLIGNTEMDHRDR